MGHFTRIRFSFSATRKSLLISGEVKGNAAMSKRNIEKMSSWATAQVELFINNDYVGYN